MPSIGHFSLVHVLPCLLDVLWLITSSDGWKTGVAGVARPVTAEAGRSGTAAEEPTERHVTPHEREA